MLWNLLISAHFIEELNVQMFSVDVYGLGVWFGSSDAILTQERTTVWFKMATICIKPGDYMDLPTCRQLLFTNLQDHQVSKSQFGSHCTLCSVLAL